MAVTATLAWITLFAPLAAALVICTLTIRRRAASAALAIGSLLVGLGCSLALFAQALRHGFPTPFETSFDWVRLGPLLLQFGVLLDPLSLLMLLVVTGVGSCIFIYSIGYMHDDRGYPRYFGCLALFAFSMLGIVLASDFIQLFIFWELVGVSSYLLIGFWYEKPSAAEAGKKAFLVNRVADFGFLLGILLLWGLSGMTGMGRTMNFLRLEAAVGSGFIPDAALVAAGLLIFCGVVGKSAQFPLHVWLPDAMEGPTPVSALIHAATMVAAGVYLLCRTFFLFAAVEPALQVIANLGAFTATFAALLAVVQNDIKRILAYSTLSQLGYMVMALGLGGYTAGMYHLTTHAFFKALLFLGAGSVIHALHTQEIWEMGGLRKTMPITTWTFTIAALALCGIFPLSGFWSKDEILALAFHENRFLYGVATITAGLTAFYMGRTLFVAFFGAPRSHHAEHPHESPPVMTGPLIVLTILSIAGGFFGIPHFLHHHHGTHVEFNATVAIISSLVAFGGLGLAYLIYGAQRLSVDALVRRIPWLYHLLVNKFFIDEIYLFIVRYVQQGLAILCNLFERYIIIGLAVNGTAVLTRLIGGGLRYLQTGKVQTYALGFAAGLTILLYAIVLRGGVGAP